jgi:two-component system chemotaxis response regulator CheB
MTERIRVLIAEDSPTVRAYLTELFESEAGLQVVGVARDGIEAVAMAAQLRPDVITMDIYMPRLNGLEATQRIMQEAPTRIIVVSSSLDTAQVDLTFNAIQAGALGALDTPGGPDSDAADRRLIAMVKAMAEVSVVTQWPRTAKQMPTLPSTGELRLRAPRVQPVRGSKPARLIALATSTGGPAALQTILHSLPGNFRLPILVVQHIASGFGTGLVSWLSSRTALKLRLARTGDVVRAGEVLFAPDDRHLRIRVGGVLEVFEGEPVKGVRPSADLLFASIASVYGAAAAVVVLTGMGDDGALGAREVHAAGGRVFAQDEESCIVYGMPREAVATGCVDQVVPLERVADLLIDLAREPRA